MFSPQRRGYNTIAITFSTDGTCCMDYNVACSVAVDWFELSVKHWNHKSILLPLKEKKNYFKGNSVQNGKGQGG